MKTRKTYVIYYEKVNDKGEKEEHTLNRTTDRNESIKALSHYQQVGAQVYTRIELR